MRRRQPRQRSASQGRGAAIGGIALLCLSLVAFSALAYFYLSTPAKPILDPVSLCPIDGPRGIHVILIDTSDDLSGTTQREVIGALNDKIASLPPYHRLDIRVLDIPKERSRSLFAKCNPGDGKGLSEWTDNPRIARMRWFESFLNPAREAMKSSLGPAAAKSSPIMAAIQDVAIDQFSSADVQSLQRSVLIISDMLEHTIYYSQYPKAGNLTYQRFRQSPAYLKFRTDLHGARVSIAYVQRLSIKIETLKLMDFWKQWIEDNRGAFESARRLQG